MKIVVVGGGLGGYVVVIKVFMFGVDVIVVEKRRVGGICLNVGCILIKVFFVFLGVLNIVKEVKDFGIEIDGIVKLNFIVIMERKNKVVN